MLASSYPIYFWNKSASMIGGIAGPYLAYLHEQDRDFKPRTTSRLFLGVSLSGLYLGVVLASVSIAKKFGKTPMGIMVTNCLVFTTIVLVAFGIVFILE